MKFSSRRIPGVTFMILVALVAVARPAHAKSISSYQWFPMGPQPSCCFFGGETGRATAIAVNPANADDLWVGTAGGGVWHSLNGGQSWAPQTDDQASLAIGSIALAECTSSGCTYVYAGTGENAIRRDTYYGAGLLVGTFNGAGYTWTLRTGAPQLDFTHGSIYNVVLDPNTSGAGQVIYITLSSGVTASATESTVTAPAPYPGRFGIFKSSDNGGSWNTVFSAGRPTDLEMDRTNTSVIYAGFLGRGIYKTTDGGTTWCALNPGIPNPAGCPITYGLPDPSLASTVFDHVEIDIAPTEHNHLYATFGTCPDRLVADCAPMVYESTDAGIHWTRRYAGDSSATTSGDVSCPRGYSRYTHGLTVDPTDPNIVFLEGFHICYSLDNGADWFATDSTTLYPYEIHPDHHAIVFFPGDPNLVYDVNDGGVALSTDHGLHWTPNKSGLAAVEFQSIATSALTARMIGGTQDNAGMMWLGSKQWKYLPCCGDGGFSILDRTVPSDMYITSNAKSLADLTVVPFRSFDGGTSWPDPNSSPQYDHGINTNEARSFYPPFMQALGTQFYFGTNRLFRSDTGLGLPLNNWVQQSPTLSTLSEPEIFSGSDVITAIAEAPSNSNRIYIGLYSGRVFVTDAACASSSCWNEKDAGLKPAPITWITVDPTDPNTAYATQSGFFNGIHVYKTIDGGANWNPTGSLTELNGVPANTIAIEQADPNTLWLGTDHGVYRSVNFGGSWSRFSNGLPNVPVYALALDGPNGRAVAATHGRGAWILTPALLTHYIDGPISKLVLDQPVFGSQFLPNLGCSMRIVRQDGSVCASGHTDALGGTLTTDADGFLVSSKPGAFANLPVVWACARGKCLSSDAKGCSVAANPMASLEVTCGPQTAVSAVSVSSALLNNPPSSLLGLAGLTGGPFATEAPVDEQAVSGPAPTVAGGGSFQLLPTLQVADGTSHFVCSVNVPFTSADTASIVLQNAANAVNADPNCQAGGVSAVFHPPNPNAEVEDIFARPGHLGLVAVGPGPQQGTQLIPSVRAGAGQSTGVCFNSSGLGNPVLDQIRAMKVRFTAGPGGALGGDVTLTERSSLGECSITVPTSVGETGAAIAQAFEGAFQAAGPGPINCRSEVNPRDVMRVGDAVVTALPAEFFACSNDPGVGLGVGPRELCSSNAECDDGNPCTNDTCNPSTGQCQSSSVPNGAPCDDGNACTAGNTCQNGTCGTPIVCNDGNACTADTCDPATGACSSQPVICDDGNLCTMDTCNQSNGKCVFAPSPPGAPCDDGDFCTVGDMCLPTPGNPVPTCQGNPKCADGNACTTDLCDPTNGQCNNPPIVCNDGDACTTDSCNPANGQCQTTAMSNGAPCDDGDRCTIGDSCTIPPAGGPPSCQGQPMVCNDGSTCTQDQCNPITGSCGFAQVPPGDVPGLDFTSQTVMTWPATPGANYWNTYRGTIPSTLLASRGSAAPVYDQTCFERADSHGDGALVATDTAMPPPGTAFYYLVSQVTGCGEGPPGTDTNGSPLPNPSPCPFP